MPALTPFKVILVGCGPAGLVAAHALSLAGINFVVLERNKELYKDNGATFVLWAHGLRLLAQMGLWQRMESLEGVPIRKNVNQTWKGKVYRSIERDYLGELFGSSTVIFSRCQVLRQLHDALSESAKANIIMGAQVIDVQTTDAGVTVKCEDGSAHEGSMVIGADGIYSNIRRLIRQIPLSEPVEKELPFEAEFKCLWFSVPKDDSMKAGVVHCINGKGTNGHILAGAHEIFVVLYEVLKPPVKGRVRYSEQDQKAFIEKWGHLQVTDKHIVRDYWAKKTVGGMTNIDEGVLETAWHRESMVIVGDAKHKMTPNMGLGFQNGMLDVVVLVNELRRALLTQSSGVTGTLTAEQVSAVCRRYEKIRRPEVLKDMKVSMDTTRLNSWHKPMAKLFDRYILPKIPEFIMKPMVNKTLGPMISTGRTLDFVDKEELYPKAEKKWLHPMNGHVK